MSALGTVRRLLAGQQPDHLARIESALASLRARNLVEAYRELPGGDGFVMQWMRGNFGHRLVLDARGRELHATPVALGVGPFGNDRPGGDAQTMQQWLSVGSSRPIGRMSQLGQVALVESIRQCGLAHPCLDWFADRLAALAEARHLRPGDLEALVKLGARKYLMTIPNADRTHELIPAVARTVLDLASRERKSLHHTSDDVMTLSSNSGFAQMLFGFLEESYPLETQQAIRHHSRR